MGKQSFSNEFKQGVVDYVNEHPELSKVTIVKQFGIADSTIHKWMKEAKEIAKLRKELKDTKDALDVLKKAISIPSE